MTRIVTIEDIAKQVYYSNKAWAEANGDFSFTASWEDAPEWQRETNKKGVIFLIQNPDAPPSASHDSWMKEKTEQGWVYGAVKDPNANPPTHPAYLPYEDLPAFQKVKDYLFRGIVMAMLPFVPQEILKNYTDQDFSKPSRGILHVTVGDLEWTPTEEEIQKVAELFQQADKDPSGAIVVTRTGIHAQYVTNTGNLPVAVVVERTEEEIAAEDPQNNPSLEVQHIDQSEVSSVEGVLGTRTAE